MRSRSTSKTISRSRRSRRTSRAATGTAFRAASSERRAHPRPVLGDTVRRPRSSRSAGSPSAIRRWCAGSSAPGTSSRATATEHRRANDQTPKDFLRRHRARRRRCSRTLPACEVRGYRAPSFSIGPRTCGRSTALREAGYRYSSSIYPIRHDHYGAPDVAALRARRRERTARDAGGHGALAEPQLPAGGGGYFRLLPYAISRWSLRASIAPTASRRCSISIRGSSIRTSRASPGISAKTRFRHYLNLDRTEARLARLARATSAGTASTAVYGIGNGVMEIEVHRCSTCGGFARVAFGARLSDGRSSALGRASSSAAPQATFFHRIGWRDDPRGRVPPSHALPDRRARRRRSWACCRWRK